MAKEIDVQVRIRVSDEKLQAAGITIRQFAESLVLFDHGFDISSVVLSQSDDKPVSNWSAAIVSA
jgi:hypothetical protein